MNIDIEELVRTVLDCAYCVHKKLLPGYLESVYKKALLIELDNHFLEAETEVPIHVYYDDYLVGDFKADILVEKSLIIELKAVQNISLEHEAQLVNYLTATGLDTGLLINFGSDKLQAKRKYRVYRNSTKQSTL